MVRDRKLLRYLQYKEHTQYQFPGRFGFAKKWRFESNAKLLLKNNLDFAIITLNSILSPALQTPTFGYLKTRSKNDLAHIADLTNFYLVRGLLLCRSMAFRVKSGMSVAFSLPCF